MMEPIEINRPMSRKFGDETVPETEQAHYDLNHESVLIETAVCCSA